MRSLKESILSSNKARLGDLITDMLRKKPTPPASKYMEKLNDFWWRLDKDFSSLTWQWNYNDKYFLVMPDGCHAASVYPRRGQAYVYLSLSSKKMTDNIVNQLGWTKDLGAIGNIIRYII